MKLSVRPALVFCAASSLFSACGERYTPPGPPEAPDTVVDLDEAPGIPCGSALMVQIGEGSDHFCIDRFEAGLNGILLGNPDQGVDAVDRSTDGSTVAIATVGLQLPPRAGLTWYQASAACENAGKRLCTVEEWERACRGPGLLVYPYGDEVDQSACNGFFKLEGEALPAGSLNSCGSAEGVYDLSGNVAEWVSDSVPRVPGTEVLNDRAIRGGSFNSNFSALRCVGDEFHAPPTEARDDLGFRCCTDP